MGSQPSKPTMPSEHEKAVLERVRDLSLDDDDFVEIGEYEKNIREYRAREAEGLPIETLGNWQSNVLDDPKNRQFYLKDMVVRTRWLT